MLAASPVAHDVADAETRHRWTNLEHYLAEAVRRADALRSAAGTLGLEALEQRLGDLHSDLKLAQVFLDELWPHS